LETERQPPADYNITERFSPETHHNRKKLQPSWEQPKFQLGTTTQVQLPNWEQQPKFPIGNKHPSSTAQLGTTTQVPNWEQPSNSNWEQPLKFKCPIENNNHPSSTAQLGTTTQVPNWEQPPKFQLGTTTQVPNWEQQPKFQLCLVFIKELIFFWVVISIFQKQFFWGGRTVIISSI
jgi:hypothetical protein